MTYFNAQGQGRVGWRSLVVTQVVNAVDADAQAFITAAGITNLTQASAINTLVNDLKTYGLWTKMKALYPMVGGTSTSHKFNLKDPRDLDAAYRLVFNGGWTHSSTGALPNGTTAYADSKYNTNTFGNLNSAHISYYSMTSVSASATAGEIGGYSIPNYHIMQIRATGDLIYSLLNTQTTPALSNNSTQGLFLTSRTGVNTTGVFKNSTKLGTNTNPSVSLPNLNLYLGALSVSNTPNHYTTKECAFASIGDGLTDTEAANFYNSVQKFQTTLGRQIGTPIVSDTDAQAFINAAGLTDLGQANAVNTLVVDLKAAGVWTKMKAVYPFVGGTATTHKWNLKDPRDLDAAFRLVFNGGWTHSATGAKPNGTTGYADTKLIPATSLTGLDHVSFYSKTDSTNDNQMIGLQDDSVGQASHIYVGGNKTRDYYSVANTDVNNINFNTTTTLGMYIASRTTTTSLKAYKNGVSVGTNTATTSLLKSQIPFYIGALNYKLSSQTIYYGDKESAFASIGDGLTDTEATAFYTAVQKYQTSLSRQIGTPVLASGQTAGLLDTYSGAAAAYSLRKLRNGYYGNAIRVRRSSDNAEQDIAFNTSGNLDTVSLLAFVGSGDGFVTTWYDQSGNGKHAVQTTAANQPFIVNTGVVNTYNSKPCVKFDGNGDYIETPYYTGTSNEFYFVTQTTDTQFVFPRGTDYYGFIAEQSSSTTNTSGYFSTQPQFYVNSALVSPTNRGAVYTLLNGYKLSVHKGTNISGTTGNLRFGNFNMSPGALDFNGNLFEFIAYPSLQSSQTSIESNINSYYTIY